mmetsp:Transcript_3827/g.12872  ORF Transcript_3827/g.12872 Transcript_3827/m.12872 type:complete len:242 (-) Transcript_3827:1263-1988(-)
MHGQRMHKTSRHVGLFLARHLHRSHHARARRWSTGEVQHDAPAELRDFLRCRLIPIVFTESQYAILPDAPRVHAPVPSRRQDVILPARNRMHRTSFEINHACEYLVAHAVVDFAHAPCEPDVAIGAERERVMLTASHIAHLASWTAKLPRRARGHRGFFYARYAELPGVSIAPREHLTVNRVLSLPGVGRRDGNAENSARNVGNHSRRVPHPARHAEHHASIAFERLYHARCGFALAFAVT